MMSVNDDQKIQSVDTFPQAPLELGTLSPRLARRNFRALLLRNPNYFGNLADSSFPQVLDIQEDTSFESIGRVGYNPQVDQLRVTITIKQDHGYQGGLCSGGSEEYVRFYLSYDGGESWNDQGMKAVSVFDVPGPKPLDFAVSLQISPKEKTRFLQNLPLVRAILSWNCPPPAHKPHWTPVWGEVKDAEIQIAGSDFILLKVLLAEAKVQFPLETAHRDEMAVPVETVAPRSLSGADLHKLYAGTKVPQHRYLAPWLAASAETSALSGSTAAPATHAKPVKTENGFGGIPDLNLSSLMEKWQKTAGDTKYEQLLCVGLDTNANQLVGIVHLRESIGYGGGPRTTGSTEYVAFWVDWGSGWEYVGTTSVTVHDFNIIPANGIDYNVFLPIDLVSHGRPSKEGPKTVRVRGVLSWSVLPSTTDPYALTVWGNALESRVLIPVGPAIEAGQQVPVLTAVGDVEVSKIGSDGRISNVITVTTGMHCAKAPFGGRITLAGQISNPDPGLKYRIMKAPHGSSAFEPLVSEPAGLTLNVSSFTGGTWTQSEQTFHADAEGYYPYQDYAPDHFVEGQLLGVWSTTATDSGQAYDLRVDLKGASGSDVRGNRVTVLVNNQTPVAVIAPSLPHSGTLQVGDTLTGTFTARSADFGSFRFNVLPAGPAHGSLPVPSFGVAAAFGGEVSDPGTTKGHFTLDTTDMRPGEYSLTLGVWDRTNVDSGHTSNYSQSSITFRLEPGGDVQ